jgi:leader peptidase (prepilin peptidase)/N-methyltransferase
VLGADGYVPELILVAAAALLGLVVGSFLNVVIYRLPIMLDRGWRRQCREMLSPGQPATDDGPPFDLVRPRSACPSCRTPIKARHNVPVVSYLWLRGRCAHCGAGISPRYPLVETFTGIVSALIAWRFGPSLETVGALGLAWALIALAVIDLDHQILPDVITLPLLWAGVLFALLGERFGDYVALTDLQSSVVGAMVGYCTLWIIYQLFRLATGKEGMGYGDFKLLAALGAWLGWQSLPLVILLSAMVGAATGIALIVVRGRDRQLPMPFGPFLAAAGLVALLWGEPITAAYRDLSGP